LTAPVSLRSKKRLVAVMDSGLAITAATAASLHLVEADTHRLA
jgi:hypothetical protein